MPELQNPFIIGNICYLRGLTEADLEGDYFQWINDYEVTRYLEAGRVPNTPENMRARFESSKNDPTRVSLAICDKATNKHIGNISMREIHTVHRRANVGIMIGDKNYWGKGYATEATFLMVDYGFRRLNLHSIWLGVLAVHESAIKVYEKVGFKVDGREREAWWADGAFHDVLHMSILAREHFARLDEEGKPT